MPKELRSVVGLYVLHKALEERLGCVCSDMGLTKGEIRMLFQLSQPCRMGDLARSLQIVPSAVTALADALETKGLITRQRDPHDRRAWQLSLSEAGRDVIARMAEASSNTLNELTALPPEEAELFAMMADKVGQNILNAGQLEETQK